MSEPAHAPGWYPDPHRQAELRWHDGTNWTEHLHGQASVPAPGAAPTLTAVPVAEARTSGMAIASLVLALLGFGLFAVIFGAIALRQIGKSAGALTGRGLALAGIIVGVVWGFLMFAILMAIAVPTFLMQKENALGTRAKANAKQLVNAVEACAAGSTSGSYAGCTPDQVAQAEPALRSKLARCGAPGGLCLVLAPDGLGYTVRSTTAGTPSTTYTVQFTADGEVLTGCSGPACRPGDTKGSSMESSTPTATPTI